MGILQVDNIIAQSSANVLTLGVSGNTVTVPANVTFNALGANVYIPSAIAKLDGITTSNTSTYNLTYGGSPYSPASATACLVSLNGIIQAPTTAFTISANTISFSTALTSTDVIDFITVLAAPYTLNVPGDGTVGITKLSATGTPSSSTYLRGDNTWATLSIPTTIVWNTTVQTTNFTASVNVGYMVNTSSAAVTVTLPAAPSIGDQIQLVDFNETAATNNIILNPNGLKIDGLTTSTRIIKSGEGVTILYSGTTRGWIPVSAVNEGTTAFASDYSVDFLAIAGGGGGASGGAGAGGYRTSYGTSGGGGSAESSLSFTPGTTYTITVGSGGSSGSIPTAGGNGNNSSISGTGLTTITSSGGGGGGPVGDVSSVGSTGGSGGAGGSWGGSTSNGGSGTANQGYAGGGNGGNGSPPYPSGGGGGAGAVGSNAPNGSTSGNGGTGVSSSITGSAVTRAGGGGGGLYQSSGTAGSGGAGGGGAGGVPNNNGTAGTANTGGGGGGTWNSGTGGAGGSGVVILRMATIHYTGTTSGSPTVTTSGSDTILTFNGSGTYSA